MYQIWIILGVVLSAGLLGGWAAYLTDPESSSTSEEKEKTHRLKRYLVLGVVAAAVVPLFLSLLQSALMNNIFSPRPINGAEPVPFSEFLIFGGFCLIAAVSARAFLDTVSKQILRDVNKANERAELAQNTATEAKEEAVAASELAEEAGQVGNVPPTVAIEAERDLPDNISLPELSSYEVNALNALTRMSTRTATGIAQDIGMSRSRIGEILDELAFKSVAERTTSPKTGGMRWRITPLGIRALNKIDRAKRGGKASGIDMDSNVHP